MPVLIYNLYHFYFITINRLAIKIDSLKLTHICLDSLNTKINNKIKDYLHFIESKQKDKNRSAELKNKENKL
jgi:hypothetical protein